MALEVFKKASRFSWFDELKENYKTKRPR